MIAKAERDAWPRWQVHEGEVFLLQHRGTARLTLCSSPCAAAAAVPGSHSTKPTAEFAASASVISLIQGDMFMVPADTRFSLQVEEGAVAIVVTNTPCTSPSALRP